MATQSSAFVNNDPAGEPAARRSLLRRRVLLILGALLLYEYLYILLSYTPGIGMAISTIIPVIAAGWMFGLTAGVCAGILSFPLNILMCMALGLDWIEKFYVHGMGVVGTFGFIIIGAFVGRMRDLGVQLNRELIERRRAEAELKEHRDRLDELVQLKTRELEETNRALEEQIRDRKLAVAGLQETKEQLENLIEASRDPIILGDSKGHIVKPNKAFLIMMGYTEQEVVGQPASTFSVTMPGTYESTAGEQVVIDQAFLDEQAHQVARLLDDGEISNWNTYYINKSGKLIPVSRTIVLLRNKAGEGTAALAIIRDITGQRAAELELIKSKEAWEHLVETSLDPIVVSDSTGHITMPNRAFLTMLGYAREEILGKAVQGFSVTREGTYTSTAGEQVAISQDFFDENQRMIERFLAEGTISNWLSYYLRKDGTVVPVSQNLVLLYDDKRQITGSFGIIQDVTEQRKAEQELIRAKEAAEEASQAKSNFLANMSHEIRTPMNGVIGFTDMLLETGMTAEQEDCARTIKRSAEALLSLINDILDFSKIEAGKIELEAIDFDIEMLAYDVCELIRPRIAGSAVDLLCRIGDDLPARISGDPHRFRQVLINLLGNAAKFTHRGEIELSVDVEREDRDSLMLHATVRDTGVGIAADKLDSIFDLFQQADGSTTRKYGGTGLGLSICRRIARLMGGDVWAESRPGAGSRFHFTALLKPSTHRQVKRFAPVALTGRRALITDDNATNREILTNMLNAAGMQVAAFAGAGEALQALQEAGAAGQPFDICILDIMMPDMSGYEMAQRIRALYGDGIRLLAFTSSAVKGAQRCEQVGFNGFLPKPINRVKLFKMIERLLGEPAAAEAFMGESAAGIVTQHSLREDAKQAISILLAEDNPVNLKLAVKLLEKAGYRVDVASTGREAVERYSAGPQQYDIVFMDIQMPELNGLDATRELRQRGFGDVPIVAMTANAMKGDREKCLAAGMSDYIAKPIKREVVLEMINRWVIDRLVSGTDKV